MQAFMKDALAQTDVMMIMLVKLDVLAMVLAGV